MALRGIGEWSGEHLLRVEVLEINVPGLYYVFDEDFLFDQLQLLIGPSVGLYLPGYGFV